LTKDGDLREHLGLDVGRVPEVGPDQPHDPETQLSQEVFALYLGNECIPSWGALIRDRAVELDDEDPRTMRSTLATTRRPSLTRA